MYKETKNVEEHSVLHHRLTEWSTTSMHAYECSIDKLN